MALISPSGWEVELVQASFGRASPQRSLAHVRRTVEAGAQFPSSMRKESGPNIAPSTWGVHAGAMGWEGTPSGYKIRA